MNAIDFVARAMALQANAAVPHTFGDYLRSELPESLTRIESNGHSASGLGAATYLADPLADEALFRQHPAAVIPLRGAKFLRLAADAGGYVTPEQLGCPRYAPGVNQQPYIQAAIAYAEAVGLRGVLLSQPRYELWTPVRPDGLAWLHPAGSCLVLSKGIALRGSGAARVILECRNARGGRNDEVVQQAAIPDWQEGWQPRGNKGKVPWIGNAILVDPAAPIINEILIDNVEIDGTAGESSERNLTHRGLHLQGNVRRVHLRDVAIRDCAGDLYVLRASSGAVEEVLENCVFAGTPGAAILSGTTGRGRYLNVVAGRAGAVEIVSGLGHDFNAVRLHDMPSGLIAVGTNNEPRGVGQPPPYCHFHEVLIENVGTIKLGAHLRGRLKTTDTTVAFLNRGRLEDIKLEIDAWADRRDDFDAVTIAGPQDRVTPVPGADPGAFYAVPSFVTVQISGQRTALAAQNGHGFRNLLGLQGGLLDQDSVQFTLTGTARQAFDLLGMVPSAEADAATHPAFLWPRLTVGEGFQPITRSSADLLVPAPGEFDLVLRPGMANSVNPANDGVHTARLLRQFDMADGQRARISLSSGDGARIIRIARAGMGARLPEDRYLCRAGDYIDLRWDAGAQIWTEAAYSTSESLDLSGTLTIENAIVVGARDVASIEIEVAGASIADRMAGLAWGETQIGPLQVSPVISADGLVTVHLYNPAATPVTLDEGTQVHAFVRRSFLQSLLRRPDLKPLSLPSLTLARRTASSAMIEGATEGSGLAIVSAPLGVSVDPVSHVVTYDGSYNPAGGELVLEERLNGRRNSPRRTIVPLTFTEPEIAPPLDSVQLRPLIMIGARKLTSAAQAARWRLTNGAEVATWVQVQEAGVTTISHAWDDASAAWLPLSAHAEAVAGPRGSVGAYNARNSSIDIMLPADTRAAFAGVAGISSFWNGDNLPETSRSQRYDLVMVSGGTSPLGGRHQVRIDYNGRIDFQGRRLDNDANQTVTAGVTRADGKGECLVCAMDFAAAEISAGRYGSLAERKRTFHKPGQTSAAVPLSARIAIPPGATFYEAAVWAGAVSPDELQAIGDNVNSWRPGYLNDAAQSWWTTMAARNPRLPIVAVGFTNDLGYTGVAEIEEGTGQIVTARTLGDVRYSRDDHNSVAVHYTDAGSLIVGVTGHHNPVTGTTDSTYKVFRSTSGRLADLDDGRHLQTTISASSYQQIVSRGGRIAIFTSDEASASWLFFYSDDDGANWQQAQASVAGGADQIYGLVRADADALHFAYVAQPGVTQNAIHLDDASWRSGVTVRGGKDLFSTATGSIGLSDMPAVYVPPAGKSCRLLDMNANGDIIAFGEFDTDGSPSPEATHFLLIYKGGDRYNPASWTKQLVGKAGSPFWQAGMYVPALVVAREGHEGIRLYRTCNAGGAWSLERLDSDDGGENWVTTTLATTMEVMPRVFAVDGAHPRMPALWIQGSYSHYQTWRLHMRFVEGPITPPESAARASKATIYTTFGTSTAPVTEVERLPSALEYLEERLATLQF